MSHLRVFKEQVVMREYFKSLFEPPGLKGLSLKSYRVECALDRLKIGVDNIRYDVLLSRDFCRAARNLIIQLIAKHSQSEDILNFKGSSHFGRDKDRFKRFCRDVLLAGIHKAKLNDEIQVDTLAQAAVIKFFLHKIPEQYDLMSDRIKKKIRQYEISNRQDRAVLLMNRLILFADKKEDVIYAAGNELLQYLSDIQTETLNDMRKINFGDGAVLPINFFQNPMIFAQKPLNDFFMLKTYGILLGHRLEDPDKYEVLLSFIRRLFIELYKRDLRGKEDLILDEKDHQFLKDMDGWLKEVDNVDPLLNSFQTMHRYGTIKKKKEYREEARGLKRQARSQMKRLDFFYHQFKKIGLIKKIIAAYEILPIYQNYCPPLVPHLISQFLTSRQARKQVYMRIKNLKKVYGKSPSLDPLLEKRKIVNKMWLPNRRGYIIRFFKDFIRYHRDFENFHVLNTAMDRVHLVTDERMLNLSRANNTLYEFLLPYEQSSEDTPILNHVIVKADIRGSTDITQRMMEKKLNPASYFSLNLFDPISKLLSDYGAGKVFVEGDAIILSIFEHKNTPEGWYSVARACGLAAEILFVVNRCNIKNNKYGLPTIEIGIGISYNDEQPAFLFDGDHRIMISSAINMADRLSGCSKSLKQQDAFKKSPFNLYVFQTLSDQDLAATADDLFLRYNVNGIELNARGFEKLNREIELRPVSVDMPDGGADSRFYTGKYPLVNTERRQLVIRESQIPRVNPDTLEVIEQTGRKYYEVCTHSEIHKYILEKTKC